MRRVIWAVALMLLIGAAAHAQFQINPTFMWPSKPGTASCNGKIDLSIGCIIPGIGP